MQWTVRPTQAFLYNDHLGSDLPVGDDNITQSEVVAAGKGLNRKRASGNDGIPPEFWKAITVENSDACQWAVILCQKCWSEGLVPDAWHEALVITIFKIRRYGTMRKL